MPSAINLLKGDQVKGTGKSALNLIKQTAPTTITPVEQPELVDRQTTADPQKFYGESAVGAPFQGMPPMVWSPGIASHVGKLGYGPEPEGGWSESGLPLNKSGKPYYNEQAAGNIISETFEGLYTLGANPMETYRGLADFALTVPDFMLGLVAASGAIIGAYVKDFAEQPLFKYADQVIKTGDMGKVKDAEIKSLDLEQVYNVAAGAMNETMSFFQPGREMLLGKPTKESQLVGEVAMAPMMALSAAGHAAADSKAFENYPNVRGALRFAGDILGLAAMGLILHGRSARNEFSREMSDITTKANEIAQKEKAIAETQINELIKQAQLKVLEAEKQQLELRAKAAAEKVSSDALIREEIARQHEAKAQAKAMPEGKAPAPWSPKKSMKKEKPAEEVKPVEEPKVEPVVEKDRSKIKPSEPTAVDLVKGEEAKTIAEKEFYHGSSEVFTSTKDMPQGHRGYFAVEDIGVAEKFGDNIHKITVKTDKIFDPKNTKDVDTFVAEYMRRFPEHNEARVRGMIDKGNHAFFESTQTMFILEDLGFKANYQTEFGKRVIRLFDKDSFEIAPMERPKPVTNLDRTIGIERTPETLKGESSPFFQDVETTNTFKGIYEQKAKAVREDVELFTQKAINDVNRWYHGEDVPIEQVRNGLRRLAAEADGFRGDFLTGQDFMAWKDVVREASEWASNLDRLKIERTGEKVKGAEPDPFGKADWGNLDLNAMIPLRMVPEAVVEFIVGVKGLVDKYTSSSSGAVGVRELLRNEKLWRKTGFWLGRDSMWRYELKKKDIDIDTTPIEVPGRSVRLERVVKSDKLYENLPTFGKDVYIKHDPNMYNLGEYSPREKTISVQNAKDINTVMHELQHAINHYMNTNYGTTTTLEAAKKIYKLSKQIEPYVKNEIDKDILRTIRDDIYKYAEKDRVVDAMDTLQQIASDHKVPDSIYDQIKDTSRVDYYKDVGEMEARLSSTRWEMTDKEREATPPWVTLDEMLRDEYPAMHYVLSDLTDSYTKGMDKYTAAGHKLYSQVPLKEALKPVTKMATEASKFFKEFKRSQAEKQFSLKYAIKQLKNDVNKAFIDTNESLFKEIRKKYPQEYQKLVDRFRSAAAGKGYGAILYEQAVREIYGGKSREMVDAINAYILLRRFKDIYSYKSAGEYRHQKGYGPDQVINADALIEMVLQADPGTFRMMKEKVPGWKEIFGNLDQKQLAEVKNSAETYFEWSRKMVDDLVEAGLKSPKEGEALKSHDFRKFKSIRVEKLYDFDYQMEMKGETLKLTNSGVESLGRGSAKMIEPDARVPLAEMFSRVYGSIAGQKSKMEWKAFAERNPDNGIVKLAGEKNIPEGWRKVGDVGEKKLYVDPEYVKSVFPDAKRMNREVKKELRELYEKDPKNEMFSLIEPSSTKGWSPMAFKEGGKTKYMYFHPDAAKYLVTKQKDTSHRFSTLIRGAMLAPITRGLAVGLSPSWATFVGLPMDVVHSLMTSRKWNPEKGKFDLVYSPFMPKASLEIGLDILRVSNDVIHRGPFTQKLFEHGLVMNFLTTRESRYMKGARPPGDFAKFLDVMSYHGLSMELLVRAATADRMIRKMAKEQGLTFEQTLNNKDIMYEAVHTARDRMDYNQGGWFTKAMDQTGFIFTNAAVLGTRTYWRQAIDNPVDFAFRTGQIMVGAAGIATTAALLYPEEWKNIPKEGNEKNVVFPLFPNWLKATDRFGDEVSFYAKLRVDPGAAFAYKVGTALTETYLYDQGLTDTEPDYAKLVKGLKELGPTNLSLPPHAQMWFDYFTNYSWWKGRQMYTEMSGKTLPWPKSEFEGKYDDRVSATAKKVGEVTGLSPRRLDDSIGNVLPQNNEFVYLMGGFMEQALNDMPEGMREDHWLISLAQMPGFNRVIGITRYDKGRRDIIQRESDEEEFKTMVRNAEFDRDLEWFAIHGVKDESEIMQSILKQDERYQDGMLKKFDFAKNPIYRTLEHRGSWLKFMNAANVEAKAKSWIKMYDQATGEEKAQLMSEWAKVYELGIITDEVMTEVGRQRAIQK